MRKNVGIRKCDDCGYLRQAVRAAKEKTGKITNNAEFRKWSTGFSASVLILITTFWAVNNAYVLFLLSVQFFRFGILDAEVLKLFIEKTSEVFLASVVSILITRTVGNVFEYNEGGIFGISKEMRAPDYANPETEESEVQG